MATRTKHTIDRLEMTAVEQLALSKFKMDKDARDLVAPGSYEGFLHLVAKYGVKVGEDYEGDHPADIRWISICALLASKVNDATLQEVFRVAHEGKVDEKPIKAKAIAAIKKLIAGTKKPFKGKVTGTCQVVRVIEELS